MRLWLRRRRYPREAVLALYLALGPLEFSDEVEKRLGLEPREAFEIVRSFSTGPIMVREPATRVYRPVYARPDTMKSDFVYALVREGAVRFTGSGDLLVGGRRVEELLSEAGVEDVELYAERAKRVVAATMFDRVEWAVLKEWGVVTPSVLRYYAVTSGSFPLGLVTGLAEAPYIADILSPVTLVLAVARGLSRGIEYPDRVRVAVVKGLRELGPLYVVKGLAGRATLVAFRYMREELGIPEGATLSCREDDCVIRYRGLEVQVGDVSGEVKKFIVYPSGSKWGVIAHGSTLEEALERYLAVRGEIEGVVREAGRLVGGEVKVSGYVVDDKRGVLAVEVAGGKVVVGTDTIDSIRRMISTGRRGEVERRSFRVWR